MNGIEVQGNEPGATWSYSTPITQGNNLFSFHSKDAAGLTSSSVVSEVLLDTTPPTIPLVSAFGLTPDPDTGLVSLHAEWSSRDAETAIVAYDCGIGSTPHSADIMPLSPVADLGVPADATSVDKPGLNLGQGDTYYLIVRATNAVGLMSGLGASQGVFINRNTPVIGLVAPADYTKHYRTLGLAVSAEATDPDGDAIDFRFTLDGTVIQDWSNAAQAAISFGSGDFGPHTIRVEARDAYNGLDFKSIRIFVIEQPPVP